MNTSHLTFTRFIAAFAIVYFHYGLDLFPTNNLYINSININLNQGVTFFYVLSGFVMILAYGNRTSISFKEYILNRFARIYPLHILALFLGIAIKFAISNFNLNIKTILLNIFLIQAWIPKYALSIYNTPAWSVSVEIFFYLCFPFILNRIISRYSTSKIILSIIIFWIIQQLFLNIYYFSPYYNPELSSNKFFLFYNPFLHLSSFLIGIGTGLIFKKHASKLKSNYDFLIISILLTTGILIVPLSKLFIHNGLLAVNFALIIYLITISNGSFKTIFKHKYLVHLGEISFSLYMLQNPVFTFLRKIYYKFHITDPHIKFWFGFIFLLIVSHFAYNIVEKPMRDRLKNSRIFRKLIL